jgi:putative aldouronate transport system substrate-binding protein
MPSNGWVAARTRGYIFGIPSITVFASPVGIAVETEYLDRYNMPYTGYKNLADIEPLLAAIKRDNPNMYPIAERLSAWGYDAQAGEHIPGVVMLEDQDLKVLNQFELPQVREHFQLLRSWYLKGYIQPDAVTSTSNAAETLAGLHPVGTTGAIYPMAESNLTNNHGGRRTIALVFNDPWMSTASITASMNAISRTSKDPVKAMQFLNLLNSDVYLYNLIARGVEGKHYRRTDAIHVSAIENSGYRPQTDWVFGNQFLAYYWEDQKGDEYERTIIQNNNGRPSPALGFSLDTSPIQTEMASVSAVVNEYLPALETGAVDTDTVLPEFIAKLRDAGSQRIIAEIQRQIDIWKAGSDTNK